MEEFKKELKALLEKYDASIFIEQEENDSFLSLTLSVTDPDGVTTEETIDSGYKNISITPEDLK